MLALFILSLIALPIAIGLAMKKVPTNDFAGRTEVENARTIKKAGKIGLYCVLGIMLISFVLSMFVIIPAGHRGVVLRMGAVTGRVLDEGLNTRTPFIESVVKVEVRTQKYEIDTASASKDLQDVFTTIALNYHPSYTEVATLYKELGMEYIDRIAAPAVPEVVKQITARYIAEDLILQREAVSAEITQALKTRLGARGIDVETVSIVNFEFSEVFTNSIEAKVAAQQAVLEATNKLERIKVEAQQAEAEAVGKANARIAAANGEAEYIRVVTDAQVAANEAIMTSLTPEILQYILLDRLGDQVQLMYVPTDFSWVLGK